MKSIRSTAILLAALLLLLVAGCGASSDGTGTTGTGTTGTGTTASESTAAPVSKKVYSKEADQICKDVPKHYFAKVEPLEAEMKKQGKKMSEAEKLELAVPPLHRAINELETLPPPKGEEQKAQQFIKALEAGVKGLEEKPGSKLSGPGSPLAEFQKLTEAYGLDFCPSL